jgi:DNA-binding winged helix-turn-helix (wHTH) protein
MLTDSDASACEANACGLRQSVTPTLCKRSTRLQAEEHANLTEARESYHCTEATQSGGVVLFGDFRLVPAARTLTRGDSPVHLGGRALDILIVLVERAGQVVSKAELFASVWPNTVVEESTLRVNVAALRKALGDGRPGKRFIVGVYGRGYSLVAEAKRTSGVLNVERLSGIRNSQRRRVWVNSSRQEFRARRDCQRDCEPIAT